MAGDRMSELRNEAVSQALRPVDLKRYRKIRRFFIRGLLHAFWWDVLLNQPLLRRFRRPWLPRYTRLAERYRDLAIELGGVLIKLGQFLSTRVDVLPGEITHVLAELQDEVPAAPFDGIIAEIESDLGRDVDQIFDAVSPEPLGAASLAQVHAARLPDGRTVVVKVLRPGIEVLVETDLAALGFAVRWLRFWKPIQRRVNLPRLIREFTRTTRRELDMEVEGKSAELFAHNFAGDPYVRVPEIFWAQSGGRTLTMEDVGFIKMSDLPALEAAGVSRSELASKVYQVYMEQIFVHNFVHADPHPGNVFVHPLDDDGEWAGEGRAFELVFVDFGMMAEVPEKLREALREFVIGFATRDPERIVQAYVDAGVLLPGADLRRVEEIHRDVLDRLWGVRMGEMREVALGEASYFLREYWDLVADMPFQVATDLLFVGRAFGLLSGLATSLDPEFDPWAASLPFAERLARGELSGRLWETVVDQGRLVLKLPGQASRFFRLATRGGLIVEATLAPDARRNLQRLDRSVRRLTWLVPASALMISGVLLLLFRPEEWWGTAVMGLAAAGFLWGWIRR
jgi:predicted unusual protein kinase regulating ubiquinone biosynthesis (AarF/ABC1/UbiB family)